MKLFYVLALMTFAVQSFAGGKILPAHYSHHHISDVHVGTRTEKVEVECYSENIFDSGGCFEKESKDVVSVTVEYTTLTENYIDNIPEQTESFVQRLDQSQFSKEELKALSHSDYPTKMKAASKILELKMTETTVTEVHTPMDALKVEVVRK